MKITPIFQDKISNSLATELGPEVTPLCNYKKGLRADFSGYRSASASLLFFLAYLLH